MLRNIHGVTDVALRMNGYSVRISGGVKYVVKTGTWDYVGEFDDAHWTLNGLKVRPLHRCTEPPATEAEKAGVFRTEPPVTEAERVFHETDQRLQQQFQATQAPLDLTRSGYMKCVWPGCDGGACTVKPTEHARGVPTMFYVFCPECGAHGPECWEKSEAARRWRERPHHPEHHPEAKISAAVGSEAPDKR